MAAIAALRGVAWWRMRDRRRLAHALAALAIPVVVLGAWIVLRPTVGQDAYAEFGARMAQGTAEGGLGFVAAMARANASAIVDAWLNALLIFWGEWWKPGFLLAIMLGAVGLGATLVRAARFEADGLYCVAFLAIVLAWPFPGQQFRLSLPIIPLVMLNALWAWQRLALRMLPTSPILPIARRGSRCCRWRCACLRWCSTSSSARARPRRPPPTGARPISPSSTASPRGPRRPPTRCRRSRCSATSRACARRLPRRRACCGTRPPTWRCSPAATARASSAPPIPPPSRRRCAPPAPITSTSPTCTPATARTVWGHPLDPAALAEPFARVVWRRSSRGGELQAVLLALDRQKIDNTKKTP
jgi:hypothetical protein